MLKLEIKEQSKFLNDISEISAFEVKYDIKFPDSLKQLIYDYEGSYLSKSYYINNEGILHNVKEILVLNEREGFASIEAIYIGHISYEIIGYIPFGIDSGGWDYNVSINEGTYGQIWVNKFDSGEENPLEFVCDSLETLITNLKTEQEIINLGF